MSNLSRFMRLTRAKMSLGEQEARIVYRSSLIQRDSDATLVGYFTEKAPVFYRAIPEIIRGLEDGFILTPFKEALARLPTSPSFRQSHFGEIAACVFAEEILGLKKIYSKLSFLSAENTNAYKMDLLLYDPKEPLEFVFGEVKSSPKTAAEGLPPGHDSSCFASLFDSIRTYEQEDLEFDLATIRDRLQSLPPEDQERIRRCLLPYADRVIRFAGFVLIDESTLDENEARTLATRSSKKTFDIDLICVEDFPVLAQEVFERLENVLGAIRAACT